VGNVSEETTKINKQRGRVVAGQYGVCQKNEEGTAKNENFYIFQVGLMT
jgi:hypothetical protein